MSGRDTNFYYSFLVLPAEKRRAIVAVWDFCRAVDDAVDEAPAAIGPVGHRERARRGWRGGARSWRPATGRGRRDRRRARALAPFISRFSLPRDAFEAVIDGVAMDLERSRYQTFDELREYCLRVASAVGLLCIEIFGYTDPRTRGYALDLGIALQLTNIIRDVGTDLARGRIYLPARGPGPLRLHRRRPARRRGLRPRCGACSPSSAPGPRDYYERAERELPRADRRRMVAARIMAGIYHAILDRIERSGYDVFGRTIRVPRPRRAVIAATVWARAWLRPLAG